MSLPENAVEPQQDVAPPQEDVPEAKAPSEEARVEALVMVLEPGDHEHLASLLRSYPHLREAILVQAAQWVGNETVARALELVEAPPAVEAVPEASAVAPVQTASEEKPAEFEWITSPLALEGNLEGRVQEHVDFIHAHPALRETVLAQCAEFEPDLAQRVREALAGPPVPLDAEAPAPVAQVEEDISQVAPAQSPEQSPEPAPEQKKAVPGWVVRARAYNQAHAGLVAEFNELTSFSCVGPMDWIEGESVGELEVDPYLVAQWQQDAGLAPDGRVGPKTVDAARVELEPAVAPPSATPAEEPPAA